MPPPRKIDLLPDALRRKLAEFLRIRGFADIANVTEELNFWLEAEGLELRLSRSAVGEYSKLLKDQRAAFGVAEALLVETTVEREGALHKALMSTLATQALRLIQTTREAEDAGKSEDGESDGGEIGTPMLGAKELASLAKMLKDLMQSAGWREKIMAEERARIQREARQEAAAVVEREAAGLGLSAERAAELRRKLLGVG